MEFKKFLQILKQNFAIVIAAIIIGGTLAFFLASKTQSSVNLEKNYYLPSQEAQNESEPTGYYSQEAARNFTDTAVGIISSAEFSQDVIKTQGSISARKIAPQLIKVIASASNYSDANAILDEFLLGFNAKMTALQGQNSKIQLKPISTVSQMALPSPSKAVIILSGLILGAVFAVFVVGFKTYLDI